MKLREEVWAYQMGKSQGDKIRYNLKLFAAVFLCWNAWAVYKRIEFYMEHSFDILKPNIDYLNNRF